VPRRREYIATTNNNNQSSLFNTGLSKHESDILEAKRLLINEGYKVWGPVKHRSDIKDQPDLVNYFYKRLADRHPDREIRRNTIRDLNIIRKLVESRVEDGMSTQIAVSESADIIDAIFDHEEEFKLKYPVVDMRILGQNKLGWVTAKALSIIADSAAKEAEKHTAELLQGIEDSYKPDPKSRLRRLERLLSNMED
jgi:hypothetical protein